MQPRTEPQQSLGLRLGPGMAPGSASMSSFAALEKEFLLLRSGFRVSGLGFHHMAGPGLLQHSTCMYACNLACTVNSTS